ncbi:MAG: DUF1772 domain-containing protein [Vicinamibacterales bacterium]
MPISWLDYLTLGAAVGCATMGGVFFAFSAFVMKALARLPAPDGIAAMQAINVVAITPPFMSALFGTAAVCLTVAVYSAFRTHPGAPYVIAGAVCYLLGTIVVTIVCNVPRNDALARVEPANADAARVWNDYVVSWTRWNHVRTVAGIAAAVLLTLGLVALG